MDPYYLTHKAKTVGFYPQLVLAGRRINENMSKWIVEKIVLKLISRDINITNAKTLILGFTFKENCPDIRNTKVIDIIKNLNKYKIYPKVVDPLANINECERIYGIQILNEIPKKKYDLIILCVGHEVYRKFQDKEWINLKKEGGLIFDLKNAIPRGINPIRI